MLQETRHLIDALGNCMFDEEICWRLPANFSILERETEREREKERNRGGDRSKVLVNGRVCLPGLFRFLTDANLHG